MGIPAYLERGGEHGHDRADWLAAENELTELPEQSNSGAAKALNAADAAQVPSPKVEPVAERVTVAMVEQ
jgi:Protein of unknown function (DUF2934)